MEENQGKRISDLDRATSVENDDLLIVDNASGTKVVEFEKILERVDENISSSMPIKSITGSAIQITDAVDSPMLLNGWTKYPYEYDVVSCGRNLLQITKKSQTIEGVNITINKDKSITFSGNSTGMSFTLINLANINSIGLKTGDFVCASCFGATENCNIVIIFKDENGYQIGEQILVETPKKFIIEENVKTISLHIRVQAGILNQTLYPMIEHISNGEDESEYPHEYEPYRGKTVHVAPDTPTPQLLESYQGMTNVIAPGEVEVAYAANKAGKSILDMAKTTAGLMFSVNENGILCVNY